MPEFRPNNKFLCKKCLISLYSCGGSFYCQNCDANYCLLCSKWNTYDDFVKDMYEKYKIDCLIHKKLCYDFENFKQNPKRNLMTNRYYVELEMACPICIQNGTNVRVLKKQINRLKLLLLSSHISKNMLLNISEYLKTNLC